MACNTCELIKEKKLRTLYEDGSFIIVLTSRCCAGHIEILPKKHFSRIEELNDDELEQLFYMASLAAAALFQLLGAQGTNIIVNESEAHLSVNVIARKQDDGLNFHWPPKKLAEADMKAAETSIKEAMMAPAEEEAKPIEIEQKVETVKPDEKKENYLIRQLLRIP